jgi:hypothetical protein
MKSIDDWLEADRRRTLRMRARILRNILRAQDANMAAVAKRAALGRRHWRPPPPPQPNLMADVRKDLVPILAQLAKLEALDRDVLAKRAQLKPPARKK